MRNRAADTVSAVDVAMTQGLIDTADLLAGGADPACGGESVFLGRTRAEAHPEHGGLRSLVYDAYEEMAVSVIQGICARALAETGAQRIMVRHSVGEVPVGAVSVAVRAVAGHRDAAFRACRTVIDQLKLEAPIWKREVWDAAATWQAGVRP